MARASSLFFDTITRTKGVLFLVYLGTFLLIVPYMFRIVFGGPSPQFIQVFEDIFPAFSTVGAVLIGAGIIIFFARYLGIFDDLARSDRAADHDFRVEILERMQELTNTARSTQVPEISIPENVSEKIVNVIETNAKAALSSAVIKESFASYAKQIYDERSLEHMDKSYTTIIGDLKRQLESWRRNANTNLLLGLGCALSGMLLMYFTLVNSIQISVIEGSVRQGDLTVTYYFISRIGLVIIVESIAFFFLKLYREDRSMIRYLRNEVTNVELKYLSLRSSVSFASADTLAKILITLAGIERNFILKKEERVISDLTHENNEIMLEKMVSRLIPSLPVAEQPGVKRSGAARGQ